MVCWIYTLSFWTSLLCASVIGYHWIESSTTGESSWTRALQRTNKRKCVWILLLRSFIKCRFSRKSCIGVVSIKRIRDRILIILCLFLVQFGNTCYANSVLQALYFCLPFREQVLLYKHPEGEKETLLSALSELFKNMSSSKRKFGVIQPWRFITRVRKENGEWLVLCSSMFMVHKYFCFPPSHVW